MNNQLRQHRTSLQNCAKRISILAVLAVAMAMASPAQTFTVIKSFSLTTGGAPVAPPVEGFDGNLYGTTSAYGANSQGMVYKLNVAGKLTTLYSSCTTGGSLCPDGAGPSAGLAVVGGTLYGTTTYAGAYGWGEVFKITPKGKYTALYGFCALGPLNCLDGQYPQSAMVYGNDGSLYGTTRYTVFKIGTSPGSGLTTLYNFCALPGCADGSVPMGTLVQGTDGNFYGTTESGGVNNQGTLFRISPTGILTTLYSFCASTGCPDGAAPIAGVVAATDGNFYGVASLGGIYANCSAGCGTIFKFTPEGVLTTLHSFTFPSIEGNYPNGLMQATDGNLYGTTSLGGAHDWGAIFQITTGGTFTLLHSFAQAGGAVPMSGVMQNTDGTFYGTTEVGGKNNVGVIFRLSMGLGSFVKVWPAGTTVGQTVAIVGNNLTGTSSVTFNGVPSGFVDVYTATLIYATVPSGATTGPVKVTTPSGVLTSNVAFQVLP
jgi:uncharacterized repeat protein (TIGR03803 family)